MSIVFSILLFSILIFLHELGHFVAAKASGVQVNEFSLFMGPAILKKKVGDTLYAIRCIPIGGYCAMEGEDGESENPRSFQKAFWWKRLIILVAGSGMNLITALLLFLIVFMPAKQVVVPVIGSFDEGCTLNGEGGLRVGDEFLEVDGEKIYVHSDFTTILTLNDGDVHDLVVLRDGQKVVLDDFLMEKHEFTDEDGTTSLRYGFSYSIAELTFADKLTYVWNNFVNNIRSIRLSVQMLCSGKAGVGDLTGPVGIVGMMSDVADASETWVDALMNMLYFGGIIAVQLGVLNLLPIPALDGGRVVALLLTTGIEAVTKKKINPKYEGYVHAVGMILLMTLIVFIMFKDIFNIFKG